MKFFNCKTLNELEQVYDIERKQVEKNMRTLHELKFQLRRENEQSYELFLHLKEQMDYSEESKTSMVNILNEFSQETDEYIRQNESKLERYRDELHKEYLRQFEKIRMEDIENDI